MKTFSIVVVLVGMLGPSGMAQQPTEKSTVLKVSGMSCGACAKTVQKEAANIEGVKVVIVSQPKGEAEITYDPAKTSPDVIAKVINSKTGFKATLPKPAEKK